jgi:AcrR family transcriptional regulator
MPASLSSLPVRRTRRLGRPEKPLITRDETARVAIALIDAEGLDALSVQSVARALNVTAPSLYYHFRDKEELLAEVALALLRQIQMPENAAHDWEQRVIALSIATRRVICEHPNAAPLLLRFFPKKLMLGAYERTLAGSPFPPPAQLIVVEALEKLTYGAALFAAAALAHHSSAMPDFDPARYPLLRAAIDAAPKDDEAIFIETLRALLDGLRQRYAAA